MLPLCPRGGHGQRHGGAAHCHQCGAPQWLCAGARHFLGAPGAGARAASSAGHGAVHPGCLRPQVGPRCRARHDAAGGACSARPQRARRAHQPPPRPSGLLSLYCGLYQGGQCRGGAQGRSGGAPGQAAHRVCPRHCHCAAAHARVAAQGAACAGSAGPPPRRLCLWHGALCGAAVRGGPSAAAAASLRRAAAQLDCA